jgi:transposase
LTIVPIVKQFAARHDLAHMVVVADAGMLSRKNLDELAGEGLFFIVGSRATKAPIDLESHFRWHGDAFSDGQVIDTITPKNSRVRENDTNRKAEPVCVATNSSVAGLRISKCWSESTGVPLIHIA